MALSSNPTKTKKIEQAFRRENRVRFKKYNKAVKEAVKSTQTEQVTNANDFSLTDSQFDRLMKFYRARAYQDIIGVNSLANANSAVEPNETTEWQRRYISLSYARGIDTAQKQLKGQVAALGQGISLADMRDLFSVGTDERAAQMLIETNILHGETVATLQASSLSSLVQATENMLAQMRRDTEFARTQVDSRITNLIKDLTKRISVANSAGEQIASTETIQAFQNAQINNATIVSDKTGEEVNVRWLTRNDSRVRHLHAQWHGKIMTSIEASQNINESPWNCRCGFAQVPPRADTSKRQAMFDKERKELIDMEGDTSI